MSISDRLDETTRRAARVIGSVMSRWDMDGRPDVDGGIDTLIARTLDEAGMLAPSPLREEWGIRWDDGTSVMAHYLSEEEARIGAGDDPVVHRWVSDWERYEKDPRG